MQRPHVVHKAQNILLSGLFRKNCPPLKTKTKTKTREWVSAHTKDKTCFTKFVYPQFGVAEAIRKALPSLWNSV